MFNERTNSDCRYLLHFVHRICNFDAHYDVFAQCRAMKNRPTHYEYGMAVDNNSNLITLKTPVYMDYKTGQKFKGKSVRIYDYR